VPVRFVHVGMGGWGQNWAQYVVPQVKAVKPVAWVDADPATLAAARKALDLPAKKCFPSLGEALAAVEADAVLVTTPLVAHVPVAVEALNAGKHVLVEKPFAPSLAEARRAVETAEARGKILMVSQNYRFFPAPRAVANLIASGEYGPVGAVAVDFRRYATAAAGHRHHTLADPLLVDMAIHHFDMMRQILGQEGRLVSCHAWNPPWSPFTGDATAAATVTFAGGPVVSWRGSWVSPGPKTSWGGEWRVECEGGEIAWTSRDDTGGTTVDAVTIRRVGKKRPIKLELPPVEPHGRAGALSAFAAAIESGTQPETSGRDNLGSLALVAAALASAASGQTVAVEV
jgi:predicted dehydrogenase